VVKAESQLEKEASLKYPAWNRWVTYCAKQNGVVLLEAFHVGIGEGFTGGVVATRTQVVLGGYKVNTGSTGCQLKRFKRNCGYLWANAVSANNGELVFTSQSKRSCE
jgi:hypothetical protein